MPRVSLLTMYQLDLQSCLALIGPIGFTVILWRSTFEKKKSGHVYLRLKRWIQTTFKQTDSNILPYLTKQGNISNSSSLAKGRHQIPSCWEKGSNTGYIHRELCRESQVHSPVPQGQQIQAYSYHKVHST